VAEARTDVDALLAPANDAEQRIADLEREVSTKEEYLQTTIEELETSNEELKSTNEEVQSANEELQSTNEEMETSKEELQSVNEELVTVNTELQEKIDELSRANNDMINLMAGTGIGTIFVDFQLRIQRFTPAATKIINLIQTDVGRPVAHLASRLVGYDHLVADVRTVLDTLIPREAEVQTTEGQFYLMRIQPYRTLENVIDGVVLTFVDVSQQTQLREQLRQLTDAAQEAQAYAESIVDTVREPLLVLDEGACVISANHAFYEFFRTAPEATLGRLLYELDAGQWNVPELRHLLEAILPQQTVMRDFAVNGEFRAIGRRALRLNARSVRSTGGRRQLILLAIEDVTNRGVT
jgi:two-component system CheB/CheR fusion protein